MRFTICWILICLMIFSCTKSNNSTLKRLTPKPKSIIGNWTRSQVLINDYWGGPIYWKNDDDGRTKIRFTSDGKYYRKKYDQDTLTLEGNFTILPDSSILVVPKNPVNYNPNNPESSNYTLYYSLQAGGYLVIGNFGFEALIKEKYLLDK